MIQRKRVGRYMSTHFVENLRVVSTVVGIGLVFAGERYFVGAPSHMWLVAVGISLMVAGITFAIKVFLMRELAGTTVSYRAGAWRFVGSPKYWELRASTFFILNYWAVDHFLIRLR